MQVLGSPNFSANAIEKMCVLDSKQPGTKASHSHVKVSDFLVTVICLISFLVCGMMLRAFVSYFPKRLLNTQFAERLIRSLYTDFELAWFTSPREFSVVFSNQPSTVYRVI